MPEEIRITKNKIGSFTIHIDYENGYGTTYSVSEKDKVINSLERFLDNVEE